MAIDLRATREAFESAGDLNGYAVSVSQLDSEIRRLLRNQPGSLESAVQSVPVEGGGPATKDALQIVDWIMVAVGPLTVLGVAQCVRLLLQLVETCRAKIPTSYEIELDGAKLKLSGPSVSAEDLKRLHEMLRELRSSTTTPPNHPKTLANVRSNLPALHVRIKALPPEK